MIEQCMHMTKYIHSFLRFCMRSDRVSDLLKQNQFKVKTKTVWNILYKNLSFKMSFLTGMLRRKTLSIFEKCIYKKLGISKMK